MTLLQSFLNDTLDPATFDHRAHVVVGYQILCHHPLEEATQIYADQLRKLTLRAGVPDKFRADLTRRAMALIAARMGPAQDGVDTFLARNPDLLDAGTFLSA